MFRIRFGVDDNVVEIYESGLPLDFGQDDIDSSLKRSVGVLEAKGHTLEAIKTLVRREGRFIPVVFIDFNLPVPAICVECCKHLRIPE